MNLTPTNLLLTVSPVKMRTPLQDYVPRTASVLQRLLSTAVQVTLSLGALRHSPYYDFRTVSFGRNA